MNICVRLMENVIKSRTHYVVQFNEAKRMSVRSMVFEGG